MIIKVRPIFPDERRDSLSLKKKTVIDLQITQIQIPLAALPIQDKHRNILVALHINQSFRCRKILTL